MPLGGAFQPLECLGMPRIDFPLGTTLNVGLVDGSQPSRDEPKSSRPGRTLEWESISVAALSGTGRSFVVLRDGVKHRSCAVLVA
jgi:hypothetical protein